MEIRPTKFVTLFCYDASRPRVKLLVDRFEPRRIDVRVELRGGDACVAEHFLDLPKIGAAGQ